MPMREIAVQIEKKQLLDEFLFLKKISVESQKVINKEKILQMIEEKERELLEEISRQEIREAALTGGEYDISLFSQKILCEDSKIILRKPIDVDLEPYYLLKKEYAYMKAAFVEPEFKNELRQEYLSEENLYYTIV